MRGSNKKLVGFAAIESKICQIAFERATAGSVALLLCWFETR
jgi:hypothetical protein